MDTLRAFPIELRAERAVFNTWIGERGDRLQWSAAVLITLGIVAVAIALSRWWFPRLLAHPMETRSAKAWAALWVFVWFTGRTPLATAAALLTFEAFGLLTARVEQIAEGLLAAGYAGLAAFVALRVIVAAAAFGALYLLLVITHTLFSTISEQSPKGQTLAASLGISAGTLAFGGA